MAKVDPIVPIVPVCSGGGNSISPPVKQISPSIHWCFTLNNYSDEDIKLYSSMIKEKCKKGGFGLEVAPSTGTPHLQGWLEFKTKMRPTSVFGKGAHWEKMKGKMHQNDAYCGKEEDYFFWGYKRPKPLKLIRDLRPWQQDVLDIVEQEPDDRTINWFYEETGGVGKTSLCKLLCAEHGAIICSGKAADMKYLIVEYHKNEGFWPSCVIFDVPRSSMGYLSYTGIEEVKNGLFASTKYECSMVVMNSPHVLVFANCEPDYEAMSTDRWNVVKLD